MVSTIPEKRMSGRLKVEAMDVLVSQSDQEHADREDAPGETFRTAKSGAKENRTWQMVYEPVPHSVSKAKDTPQRAPTGPADQMDVPVSRRTDEVLTQPRRVQW